jgi:hypothetical protein
VVDRWSDHISQDLGKTQMTIEDPEILMIPAILFCLVNVIILCFEPKIATPKHRLIFKILTALVAVAISYILFMIFLLMITDIQTA